MTFKDICLERGYKMLDDYCAEIETSHGIYMLNLSDSTLVLFTKEKVLDQGFIPFPIPIEQALKNLPNTSLKAIKSYLNIWEKDYYLTPEYEVSRIILLSELEKLGDIKVMGNPALENLVLAVYKQGLKNGMPFC